MLIDNIDGDTKEFYALVKEEVLKLEIPGVKFDDRVEFRPTGLLSSEKFPALYVHDGTNEVKVFAHQYARSFYVSGRPSWRDAKMGAKADDDPILNYGLVALFDCFTESVNRAVQNALSRYVAKKNPTVAESINPKDVFQSPEAKRK